MKKISVFIAVVVIGSLQLFPQIIHVPADQPTIQAGIDSASNGDTVLIAEGTYFENIRFNGKAIILASMYIMDGDTSHISRTIIDGSQAPDPDKATVVTFNNCQDTTSVLNGFTITGGRGEIRNEWSNLSRDAGGIAIFHAGGMVINNIVKGNSIFAESGYISQGGGITVDNFSNHKNVIIRNNTIYDNHVSGDTYAQGGGIFAVSNGDTVIIDNNRIYRNSATCTGTWKANGGGIQLHTAYPWTSILIVKNNKIYENEIHCVASHGGGIFLSYPRNTSSQLDIAGIQIYNNIIADNYSEDLGGGIAIWDQINEWNTGEGYKFEHPSPLIYNNTIVGNTAADASGLYNFHMNALLFNNIIRNDSTSGQREITISTPFGKFQSYFNNIRGGFPGVRNFDQDPLFNPDDYTLMENSPCVGSGGDSVYISGYWYRAPESDLKGSDRRMASADQKIDMGATESAFEQIKWPGYDSEQIINVPDEQATIQAAIDAASEEDTVLVAPWIYYENVDFKGKAITLLSYYGMDGDDSHISNTVIDGGPAVNRDTASVVRMVSGEDTTSILKGFTIMGGAGTLTGSEGSTSREGGGILMFRSGGLIEHNIITGNKIEESGTVWALGAGISASNDNTRTAIIRNNVISGNTIETESPTNGGGISLGGANFILENNQVSNNHCKTTSPVAYGGGLGWWSFDSGDIVPNLKIVNNDIYQNSVNSTSADMNTSGGGMRLINTRNQGTINILNNRIRRNNSEGYGGGITIVGATNMNILNNLVVDNSCEQAGGGLVLSGVSSMVISNNTIFNNMAKRGVNSLFLSENSSVVLFNNILRSPRNPSKKEITSSAEDPSNTLYAFHNTIKGGWDMQWNMDIEPAFAGDYHLSENSLCIGRGADSVEAGGKWYLAPERDMMGNPRKNMERIDLGALESSFARLDSFAITSVKTDTDTPDCEGTASITFTGGTPPFSFYLDGEPNADNNFESLCSGSYEISVEDADGEMVSTTINIETGINDPLTGTRSLKIYPNPTNHLLTIETVNPNHYSINITSLNGQQIHTGVMEGTTHQIDLSAFRKGVYFITVRSNDFVSTRKFIKL